MGEGETPLQYTRRSGRDSNAVVGRASSDEHEKRRADCLAHQEEDRLEIPEQPIPQARSVQQLTANANHKMIGLKGAAHAAGVSRVVGAEHLSHLVGHSDAFSLRSVVRRR